tara:strand:+ start:621 stop:824 length:204 start_codon:yes stop_codon:yes gene_type:complete
MAQLKFSKHRFFIGYNKQPLLKKFTVSTKHNKIKQEYTITLLKKNISDIFFFIKVKIMGINKSAYKA